MSVEASLRRRAGVAPLATSVAFGASLLLRPLMDPNAFALFCAAAFASAWYVWAALLIGALDARRKRAGQERERILERAEAERARVEAALHQMPAGVVIADAATGRLLLRNRKAEEILRRPLPPVLERYDEFRGFHLDGRPYAAEESPLARAIRAGEVVGGEEIDFVRGDGVRATAFTSAAPIRDGEGRIIAGVVTF